MNPVQQRDFLALLKALGDKHRLVMVRMMSDAERTVTEMAAALQVTEPTVSHHVSKLHECGLLRLRMSGNQRFYQLNTKRLAEFKALAGQIDTPVLPEEAYVPDNAWIDALDWPAEDKKVLRDYTDGGKLVQIPTKEKKWLVILRWLATQFEGGVRYSEKQVNALLKAFNPDYATLRRDLVEFGFMRRERGGGDYWLAPDEESETSAEG